jgi:hypothetical protein
LMLVRNLGLEIVAIHPDSEGILRSPEKKWADQLSSPGLTR